MNDDTSTPPSGDDSQPSTSGIQDEGGDEITQLKNDLEAMTNAAKRAMADLQNFKRRTEEERAEIQIYANLQLLLAIFPAIDDLDRAMQNLPEELKGHAWANGVSAIQGNLLKALSQLGLTIIEQTGVPLDPLLHEVLLQGEGQKNEVIQILEKGYAFKGKALKPAKVMVGKGE